MIDTDEIAPQLQLSTFRNFEQEICRENMDLELQEVFIELEAEDQVKIVFLANLFLCVHNTRVCGILTSVPFIEQDTSEEFSEKTKEMFSLSALGSSLAIENMEQKVDLIGTVEIDGEIQVFLCLYRHLRI